VIAYRLELKQTIFHPVHRTRKITSSSVGTTQLPETESYLKLILVLFRQF